MMNEEVMVLDINKINTEELPTVLSSQFDQLAILEDNVQKAVNMAAEAKNKAEDAQVKIGLFEYSKKEAINLLQSASEGLAEGLMTAAEAQKVSFEYQTKLTEITKFLFGLGISNLAMNRSVVRELELKLKGASEEEMSDLARQELKNVIMQLKAQEDIMNKQTELTGKVKKHQDQLMIINRRLDNSEESEDLQDKKIAVNIKSISDTKKTLEKQQQKDFEHDKQIDQLKKYNKEQDRLITTHSEKLLHHDKVFQEQDKRNVKFEEETSDNRDKIKNLESSLKQQEETFKDSNNTLDKKYADITKQLKDELSNLIETTQEDSKIINDSISELCERMNLEIALIKETLSKTEVDLSNELNSLEQKLVNTVTDLKGEISNSDKEVHDKFTDLKERINSLDVMTSKLGWKIGISIIAVGSLILNILQICGIL